ncbi:type II and III secretion system protein family protein [Urbifossiella limnaea]|uniref:Type II secretion system protein D n=1 Tax=Urbifossiella limnaea TaxID=2528023 RepID=A0A517XLZ3_9BACT|nr:pilus assembly protein N-terminal domain-containing protein [Urbifossiella limnaea]QDU18525.1 Type II secretion system protein D precursor [Urbifossiella limnaea]
MTRTSCPADVPRCTGLVRVGGFAALFLLGAAVLDVGNAAGLAQPPAPEPLRLGIPGPITPAVLQQPMQPLPAPGVLPGAGKGPSPGYIGPLSSPLMSAAPPGLGGSPKLTAAAQEKLAKYVAKLIDPETTLDLAAGQTRVLVLKGTPARVQAGDESIASVNVLSPKELIIQGKGVGATVLNIWFADPNDPAKTESLSYLVRVFPDPEAKERLDRAYQALEADLNKFFPDSRVKLRVLGDKLVVSGRVRDFVQGGQVLQVVRSNMQGAGGTAGGVTPIAGGGVAGQVPVLSPPGGPTDPTGATQAPSLDVFRNAGGPNVINLLEVAGEQQVMLRVVVAEVNRAAARTVGLNFAVTTNQGLTVFANKTGPVIGGLPGVSGLGGLGGFGGAGGQIAQGGAIANLPFVTDAGRLPFALAALKTLSYAKSLAEPNLVAMNGQSANFLAGGQFPVPIIGGFGGGAFGGGGLQGVQFVPYGVQLSFTPFITDRDRIRLVLNAAVSSRDLNSGTNIGGGTVAGLNTRQVNTTVELRQGETLAVAGLIQTNHGADSSRVPFIGDIPGLGQLTGVTKTSAGEQELVIFLTPELARPLDADQHVTLPGHEILDPTDVEFYLFGRIEGHCRDFRSPIRTDCSRIKQFYRAEGVNLAGPTGYTPLP